MGDEFYDVGVLVRTRARILVGEDFGGEEGVGGDDPPVRLLGGFGERLGLGEGLGGGFGIHGGERLLSEKKRRRRGGLVERLKLRRTSSRGGKTKVEVLCQ